MQKVIISILHYNSNKDTVACLDSLLSLQLKNTEVETYVLDNASLEELRVDTEKYKKIGLVVLKNNINLGFTGGHNLIYETVKNKDFDFFLLLNNDSQIEEKALQVMVDALDHPNKGAAVPKIYFTKGREFHKDRYKEGEHGKVFWYAGGSLDWRNVMSLHRGVDEVDRGQYDEETNIDFATGACLLIRREVLKKIGLFDERYFLYFEDADLSVRIRNAGFSLLYVPNAVVWHNNAGSSGSGSALHDYYLTRNRILFGMKFAPFKTKAALVRESMRLLVSGRKWQKIGISDYYLRRLGKGSFVPEKK